MSTILPETISTIKKCIEEGSPITRKIKNPTMLYSALAELDGMIGMEDIKVSISRQLKYILYTGEDFRDHLLHSIIYGPPGVGKTEVGKILAKIWTASGMIQTSPAINPRSAKKEDGKELGRLMQSIMHSESKLRRTRDYLHDISADALDLKHSIKNIKKDKRYKEWKVITESTKRIHDYCCEAIDILNEGQKKTNNVDIEDIPFKVTSAEDFIAGYVGQTALKTEKLLNSCLGKVVFIDEFYSLGTNDFSIEALTVINRFMTEYPGKIFFIVGGYKDLIQKTVFVQQPGLQSRFGWVFEIPDYDAGSLHKIFMKQAEMDKWVIKDNLKDFFSRHLSSFPAFGRDTKRFLFQCALVYCEKQFGKTNTKELTLEICDEAVKAHDKKCKDVRETLPMMYL